MVNQEDNYEKEPDPTKEAFFSGMEDIEKEIASEALELVKHALSLLESQFYDDSIEILRQATGLYAQINKESEVEAIKGKIENIYLLREENFKKRELQTLDEIENIQGSPISEQAEDNLYDQADKLIVEAIGFVNDKNFDQALDTYDDVVSVLKKLNKSTEMDKVNELIEDCYNRKADYLRNLKSSPTKEDNKDTQVIENSTSELELKAKRIKAYEDAKRKENEFSIQAYELIGKATELRKIRQFDEAIGLLEKSISLFREINWSNEVNKIENMKEQIGREKEKHKLELQRNRARQQQELEEEKKEAQLVERATVDENLKQEAQAAKVRKSIERNQEEETFQNNIADIIDSAEKLAREYELNLKKNINKGIFEECAYPRVIELYEEVRNKAKERGWKDQVALYEDQIKHYKILLEKDRKLRQIEAQKIQKQKLYDESLNVRKELTVSEIDSEKLKILEEKKRKEIEVMKLKETLNESVKLAEKMAREYEVAFKKAAKTGNLNLDSKYPEILKIFINAKNVALEKGWNDDANIFSSHIRKYTELSERDIKIREIEAKKNQDQKSFEDYRKVQKEDVDIEKLTQLQKQRIKGSEDNRFQKEITELVEKAEKMARDYDIALKKGLKKGNLIKESPFSKIIELYNQIRDRVISKGWKDQILLYTNQLNIYQGKWDKDRKLRELELQKIQKQKEFDESLKVKVESAITPEKLKDLEIKRELDAKAQEFQKGITENVEKAEKLARDYDLEMKKALKEGNLVEGSPYLEIIEIYTHIRKEVLEKGWTDQGIIYTNQIKIYQEKLEKDKKIHELELQKIQKQKEFDESLKVKVESAITPEKLKDLEIKRELDAKAQEFQEGIAENVEKAEKLARDYDLEMKKALKEGKLVEGSPYLEIIEIYTHIRKEVLEKGWTDQGLIYANQIKLYQEKVEKDKKLRDYESEKVKKQQKFIESQKTQIKAGLSEEDKEKLRKIEDLTKQEQEEKLFEQEIDKIVDGAEKEAREYEMAIKKGQFDKKCPYLGIVEIYKNLRKKVYARGWKDEAELYANQITLYHEKYQKDERLRELEGQKAEKQKEFEESLKVSTEIKPLKLQELQALNSKNKETDEIMTQALNLIDEAEKLVRSYEVNLKKDILSFKSPYEEVIDMYTKARIVLQKIGWNEEAQKLHNTIGFYENKKLKDDNLRAFELQKAEESKITPVLIPKDDHLLQEKRIEELKKLRESKSKESEKIFKIISQAEKIAKDYENMNREDILKVEPPYKEIIQLYKNAKIGFEKIGWVEQANQLINSINYYQEKLEEVNRLRVLEFKRNAKQKEELKRLEKETLEAKHAEEEKSRVREEKLAKKKRSVMIYEAKKDQAFDLMDLANKELKLNNFDKAVKYYKESQTIFDEMNWPEGIKMTNEAIDAVNLKKQRIELEKEKLTQKKLEKDRVEAQLEEQISKAKDLHETQQEQRRRELKLIQEEKEREKETSDNAYRLLEEGTKLKDDKMFDDSYQKYIVARDLFKKIGWQIEVSRINNDLLIKLNKEKKQTERLEALKQKKVEKEEELKLILKEDEEKKKELERIKIEEKNKQRVKLIQKERDKANEIIKNLKYNEGILALMKIIKKIRNTAQDKLVKEILKQIEVVENASQVPIIIKHELDDKENIGKVRLAYLALDKAQISLSNNLFMKAITELREAIFNLKETEIGESYIPEIEDRINIYMKELDIKQTPKPKEKAPKDESDDIRTRIARRREERRKRINDLMD